MHPKPQQRRPLSGTPLLFSAHFLCASIFCANSPCCVQYHSSVPRAKYGSARRYQAGGEKSRRGGKKF